MRSTKSQFGEFRNETIDLIVPNLLLNRNQKPEAMLSICA